MKKLIGLFVFVAVLGFISGPVFAGSSVKHWYLYPDGDDVEDIYPEAIAKLTFNAATGDWIIRGHGLEAEMTFVVASGGNIGSPREIAIGNGDAGLGNNVVIKGNIFDENISCSDLGGRWNLLLVEDDGTWLKVLSTNPADGKPRDFCLDINPL